MELSNEVKGYLMQEAYYGKLPEFNEMEKLFDSIIARVKKEKEKSIDYIRRKAADTSDKNSEKKVNLATKAIKNITKTNLDGDVAIQVSKGKGEDGREQKQLYSLAYAKELDGNAFYGYGSTGKRIKLDKTKTYYHASSKGGLKYLTPQKEGYSNRNDYKGDDINGNPIESKSSYIYPSKRIYITSDKPDKK